MPNSTPRFVQCHAPNRAVSYRQDGLAWLVEVWEGMAVIRKVDAGSETEAHRHAQVIADAMEPMKEKHEQPTLDL